MLWAVCLQWWEVQWCCPHSPLDLFNSWCAAPFRGILKWMWATLFYVTIWSISNRIIFEDYVPNWELERKQIMMRWGFWVRGWLDSKGVSIAESCSKPESLEKVEIFVALYPLVVVYVRWLLVFLQMSVSLEFGVLVLEVYLWRLFCVSCWCWLPSSALDIVPCQGVVFAYVTSCLLELILIYVWLPSFVGWALWITGKKKKWFVRIIELIRWRIWIPYVVLTSNMGTRKVPVLFLPTAQQGNKI